MKTLLKLLVCSLILALNVAVCPVKAQSLTLPSTGSDAEGIMGTPYWIYVGADVFWVLPVVQIPSGNTLPFGAYIDFGQCQYFISPGVGLAPADMYEEVGLQVEVHSLSAYNSLGIALYVIGGL